MATHPRFVSTGVPSEMHNLPPYVPVRPHWRVFVSMPM